MCSGHKGRRMDTSVQLKQREEVDSGMQMAHVVDGMRDALIVSGIRTLGSQVVELFEEV